MGEESVMMTGHQCVSGGSASQSRDAGQQNEDSPRMTPADYIYRIATLVAVIFLLATVF
jgi:hypothetical protein